MARSTPDPPQKDAKQPDFVQRGKVLIVRRQFQEAVKICRLGLLAHPTYVEGRLVLGMSLMALSRYDEVLAEMRVALELDPQNAIAYLLKGEALLHKRDYGQAKEILVKAQQLDPSNTKISQLLEELADVSQSNAVPRARTQTKVYPAQLAHAIPREPSDVLDAVRRLSGSRFVDATAQGDAFPAQEQEPADDGPTEPDPMPAGRVEASEEEQESEEREYTTAPFLAPSAPARVRGQEDSWDEGTFNEDSPQGMGQAIEPKDTVERDGGTHETALSPYPTDPGDQLPDPLDPLVEFREGPADAAAELDSLPAWDTSDVPLGRDMTDEDGDINVDDEPFDEPAAALPADEPGLSVLFPSSTDEGRRAKAAEAAHDRETVIGANAVPPEAFRDGVPPPADPASPHSPSLPDNLWRGDQPRSSGDPTKALDLAGHEHDLGLPERPVLIPPASAAPTHDAFSSDDLFAEADRAAPRAPPGRRRSDDSDLLEISVEMLPEEMPPVPSDARAILKEQSSDLRPIPIVPSPAAAASPVPPSEEEDEFATRVNFDPADEETGGAMEGLPPAGEQQEQPHIEEQPDERGALHFEPSYSADEGFGDELPPTLHGEASYRPADDGFGPEPVHGLQPPPTYLPPDEGFAGRQAEPSYDDDFDVKRGAPAFDFGFDNAPLQPEPSYPPADIHDLDERMPNEPSYEEASYDGDFLAPPARDLGRAEPGPSDRKFGRDDGGGVEGRALGGHPSDDDYLDARRSRSERRQLGSSGASGRARTAALEDAGRAYPFPDSSPPEHGLTRETSPEGPRVLRQPAQPRRAIEPEPSDSGLFEVPPAKKGPRRRRPSADRTHTSFLTLLMGEPGSHRGLYLAIGAVTVLAAAVGIGLAVRYLRLGDQIEIKRKQAVTRLRGGNLPDYNAAAQSYAEILSRRSGDAQALWAHAHLQAAIPFEFGDSNPAALRLPEENTQPVQSDRLAAEIYTVLNAGALERATELVNKARQSRADDGLVAYLEGRVRLLQGNAVEAANSLEFATRHDPTVPLYFMSLGEALSAQRKYADAKRAFMTALKLNPQHVGSLLGLTRVLVAEGARAQDVQRQLGTISIAPCSRGQRGWAYLIEAEWKFRQGKAREADVALSQAKANAPTQDATFHDEMARVLIEAYELAQAERAVKESKRIMPTRPQPFYYQAQIHLRNGLPRSALDELAHTKSLSFVALTALRAQIYLELGQLAQAEAAVKLALGHPGDVVDAFVVRARILAAQKSFGQAIEVLTSLAEKHPNDARLLTALGEVHMAEGKHDLARVKFIQAIEHDKNATQAQLRLAQLLELEGKWREARTALETAHRQSYGNVAVQKELARLEADTGALSEAVNNYQRIVARIPGDTGARLALARVRTLQRELEAAEKELKQVQGHAAEPGALALGLGRLALARGNAQGAIAQLEAAKRGQRGNPELWDLLVRAQLEAQDEHLARRTAQEMATVFPGTPEAELAMARVDYIGGQLASAVRDLARATQSLIRHPRPPVVRAEILVMLGRAHQDNGNAAAANDEFQRATEVCSNCADPFYYRGLLLDERQNPEDALRALEQSVKLDPKRPEAFYWLGLIREKQGQIDQAREAYTKCLTLHPSEDHRSAASDALQNLQKK